MLVVTRQADVPEKQAKVSVIFLKILRAHNGLINMFLRINSYTNLEITKVKHRAI